MSYELKGQLIACGFKCNCFFFCQNVCELSKRNLKASLAKLLGMFANCKLIGYLVAWRSLYTT